MVTPGFSSEYMSKIVCVRSFLVWFPHHAITRLEASLLPPFDCTVEELLSPAASALALLSELLPQAAKDVTVIAAVSKSANFFFILYLLV